MMGMSNTVRSKVTLDNSVKLRLAKCKHNRSIGIKLRLAKCKGERWDSLSG